MLFKYYKNYKLRIKVNFYSKNYSNRKKATNNNFKIFTWNSFLYGMIFGIIITIILINLTNKLTNNKKIKNNNINTIKIKSIPKYNNNLINNKSESKLNNTYDFYNLLSNNQKKISEEKNHDIYMLEIGSFKKLNEADELKAKLALIGFETKIQIININDNQLKTFKLVIGPFNSQTTAILQKNKLSQSGIQNILIKNL